MAKVTYFPADLKKIDTSRLAQLLPDLARQLDDANQSIRRELIAMIDRGDTAKARQVIERWLEEDPIDLAESL